MHNVQASSALQIEYFVTMWKNGHVISRSFVVDELLNRCLKCLFGFDQVTLTIGKKTRKYNIRFRNILLRYRSFVKQALQTR